jgi:transcriptional regulator with XRE-family HTH domain
METLKQSFGRRVRALREKNGHSREFLSQYVELDPQSLYRLEKGDQWIAPEKLELLARFYAVPVAYFFTDDAVTIDPTPAEIVEKVAKQFGIEIPSTLLHTGSTRKNMAPDAAGTSPVTPGPPALAVVPAALDDAVSLLNGMNQFELSLALEALRKVSQLFKQTEGQDNVNKRSPK